MRHHNEQIPMMIFNVGNISTHVLQQLNQYDRGKMVQTLAIPATMKLSEYVLRQWYVFALDRMMALTATYGKGWCRPEEEITRFALRTTTPEMDMLYRTLRVPENTWRFGRTLALKIENRGRDLHLEYVPYRR